MSKLDSLPSGTKVPNHIAIVLDGNRRWARSKGLPTSEGHKAGYQAMRKVLNAVRRWGVHTLTVWGFSTENWERSEIEIKNIISLVKIFLKDLRNEAKKEDIRFVHLGRKDRFPEDVVKEIERLEQDTKHNQKHLLNAALDYGGRDEILRAVKKVIKDGIKEDELTEEKFASYLDTADQPYPYVDLFIRPSGEQRTSGLLPWQATYAEFYWEPDYLPDFTPEKLKAAILDYSRRRRRFGADDIEKHFKFNPKIVANLEVQWRHALSLGEEERFRDLVVRFVKEHYGLSKNLAKTAGLSLAKALLYGQKQDWKKAKNSLEGLYKIVKKTFGLALEPKFVANFEIDLWRKNGHAATSTPDYNLEDQLKEFYAEIYRVSEFQAAKIAHLAALAYEAKTEAEKTGNKKYWQKAEFLLEQFYSALKSRVA